MAAISIVITRGKTGTKLSDFTTGTNAPSSGDFEFRYNTTDANSVAVTRKDLQQALEAFERIIEQGGANVNLITAPPL